MAHKKKPDGLKSPSMNGSHKEHSDGYGQTDTRARRREIKQAKEFMQLADSRISTGRKLGQAIAAAVAATEQHAPKVKITNSLFAANVSYRDWREVQKAKRAKDARLAKRVKV